MTWGLTLIRHKFVNDAGFNAHMSRGFENLRISTRLEAVQKIRAFQADKSGVSKARFKDGFLCHVIFIFNRWLYMR